MAEIVQRWRVVYRRGPGARDLAQRAELEAWESALAQTRLPVATTGGAHARPRLAMPPPLPAGLTAERELLDLHLVERRPSAEVRERLVAVLPTDHALVDLFDVWVGAPPLPAVVVAADYVITIETAASPDRVATAVGALLRAGRLARVRRRGDRETEYDLRPFLLGLSLDEPSPAGVTLRMRLGSHPEQGTGRPDEVVAALADELAEAAAILGGTRTRIWTADEMIVPLGRDDASRPPSSR